MKMNVFKLSVLILTSLSMFSCQSNIEEEVFDYGKIENGVYSNDYFGFSIEIPDKWVVQSQEQQKALLKVGEEIVTGDDENMKALIKASKVNSAYLLTVFQFEVGTFVDYNSNFMIVAENIKNFPGIKDGAEYLKHARELLKKSHLAIDSISSSFDRKEISGVEFYSMTVNINYMGTEIVQRFNTTVKNGFSLSVIYTYSSKEQQEILLNTLESIDFKHK